MAKYGEAIVATTLGESLEKFGAGYFEKAARHKTFIAKAVT
jgi:hypothetical protein